MEQLKLSEKKEFFNALFYLYSAGYSYTELFKSLEASTRRNSLKKLCSEIRRGIEEGIPFRDLITSYKSVMGETYAMLLCAGDMSGKTDEALATILKDITRTENLRSMLISSLTYPTLLFLGAIGVFFFCQFFFFKVFDNMYTGGMDPTSVVPLFFSAVVKIVIIYILLFALLFLLIKNKKAHQKVLDFIVDNTFLAGVVNNYYYTNFFSVLAASYEAGIPVVNAVSLASSVLKTKRSFLAYYKMVSVLQSGAEVIKAFSSANLFSDFALSQIAVGEKTGKLGEAFQKTSFDYERKLQDTITYVSKLLNPIAIVLMGILVAYIVVSFYGRLYSGIFNSL